MTNVEAGKIVERLKVAFNSNRFKEAAFTAEYMKTLLKYGFEHVNAAIDRAKEDDSEWAPPVSKLIKLVKENPRQVVEVHNDNHCDICNDKGYVLMTEQSEKYDNLPVQYALHCICQVGMSQAYDGKNCKPDERSPYIVPSIAQYFDDRTIEDMRRANRNKTRLTDDERENIKRRLARLGIGMPTSLNRGDAWEGDAPWDN